MRIPRFYLPGPLASGITAPLDDRVFNHAVRVLRLGAHTPIVLFDGHGAAFAATLTEVGKRTAAAQVGAALSGTVESPLRITLAQGISRGEKMDYTLQKAVELGVAAIQPLFTERSGVPLAGERLARKREHWQGVIIGACEQCGRSCLPDLREPLTLADGLLGLLEEAGLGLLLDPQAAQGLRGLTPPAGPIVLLAGSEGGLTPGEIARAQAAGWIGVRLGPRILRTETAGLAALAALQVLWGDGG
jgi:16S rRNA (uracil1498-N3)-methyltransferase